MPKDTLSKLNNKQKLILSFGLLTFSWPVRNHIPLPRTPLQSCSSSLGQVHGGPIPA